METKKTRPHRSWGAQSTCRSWQPALSPATDHEATDHDRAAVLSSWEPRPDETCTSTSTSSSCEDRCFGTSTPSACTRHSTDTSSTSSCRSSTDPSGAPPRVPIPHGAWPSAWRCSPLGPQPHALRQARGTQARGTQAMGNQALCSRALRPGLLLVLVAALALAPCARTAPFTFTDVYTPGCKPMTDPPPGGYQRWSNTKTWGGGPIPGVGKKLENVTIPCNKAILLDVPSIRVNVLQIQGMLKVLDPPKATKYWVWACFVLVEGQLIIGSRKNQFASSIRFTLTPNPANRQEYSAWFSPPADRKNPRALGHKGFAVMGGYVDLHGMPGGPDTPSWVKLIESAQSGQSFIVVDQDVTKTWPVGGSLAIASTSFAYNEAEEFQIKKLQKHPKGTKIFLSAPLLFNHFGDPKGVPDGFGGFIDERGEVALLSRNIMITGQDEPFPHQYEGGHFILFFTQGYQSLEGVEFWRMGQQGTLGRYNIHLHVCGDTRGKFIVRKNAMHDSKQRCIVVHATHNVTFDSNVAYNTSGHCYLLEEGGEQDNTFINNIGFLTRKVDRLILNGYVPGTSIETDVVPSTFWITNMRNKFIGNVAAGSQDSGFWTELRPTVRGMSQFLPRIKGIVPIYTPVMLMRGNVVHSNDQIGFRIYPHGINARTIYDTDKTDLPQSQWPTMDAFITGLTAYKHKGDGVFMHLSSHVYLANSSFADNTLGVDFQENTLGGVINSRFVGLSKNTGTVNPRACEGANGGLYCAPLTGCKINPAAVKNLRDTGGFHWLWPRFGIQIRLFRIFLAGETTYTIANNRFSGFSQQCGRMAAGVGFGVNGLTGPWWNAGQSFSKMLVTRDTSPVYFAPNVYRWPLRNLTWNSGDAGTNLAVWDRDGSMVGGRGGMMVANDPLLKPLPGTKCVAKPGARGMACPGVCYRTLEVSYQEDGFSPLPPPPTPSDSYRTTRKRGEFSFVTIRRTKDNLVRVTDGNLNDWDQNQGTKRYFFAAVQGPAAYEVTITPPFKRPNWKPANLSVGFRDGGSCGAGITVTVNSLPGIQWETEESEDQFWSPCAGVKYTLPHKVIYAPVCKGQATSLRLQLGGQLDYYVFLLAKPAKPCTTNMQCGLHSEGDWYFYSTNGRDQGAPRTGSMGFQMPLYHQAGWRKGRAMIGYAGKDLPNLRSVTQPPNGSAITFYYRRIFAVLNSACYTGLFIDHAVTQGMIVYLNGVELLRFNMPQGPVINTTLALTKFWWPTNDMSTLNSSYVDLTRSKAALVEGTNYWAFETHLVSPSQAYSFFDTRMSLRISSPTCKGRKKSAEVCDGLDNDGDGRVDINPKTRKLLTRPCSTPCGVGVETCLKGAYANCSARPARVEICNGKDDNCDGFVDNSNLGAQLNCARGSVCYQGQCMQQLPVTTQVPLIRRGSAGWRYMAGGNPLYTWPFWFSSSAGDAWKKFKPGKAPFATPNSKGVKASTQIPVLGKTACQYYFLFPFTLSAQDARATYSLVVRARRNQGVVVMSNARQVMRDNMPGWFDPGNPQQMNAPAAYPNTDTALWYNNTPDSSSSGFTAGAVKAGQNWVAAVVAIVRESSTAAMFDLEVWRNAQTPCPAGKGGGKPKACVRFDPGKQTSFVQFDQEGWKFLDASKPIPGSTWDQPSFNDAGWKQGTTPLGNIKEGASFMSMNRERIAYYFRKTLNIPDGLCFFSLLFKIDCIDGCVVYVNGVEAFRWNFDPLITTITPTTYSSNGWPSRNRGNFTLSSGWLKKGKNVIAAEMHLSAQPTAGWYFDLSIDGQREAVTCTPKPLT